MSGPCIDDWKVSIQLFDCVWTQIIPNCFCAELSKLSFLPTEVPVSDLIPINWWLIHRLPNGLISHLSSKTKKIKTSVFIFNDCLREWNISFKLPDLEPEEVFIDMPLKPGEVPEEMMYKGIWIAKETWRKSPSFYVASIGVKQYYIYVDE
jgi:hypothetical protein